MRTKTNRITAVFVSIAMVLSMFCFIGNDFYVDSVDADTPVLNADDVTAGDIKAETEINSVFSITASESNKVVVEANKKKTADGKFTINQRIKLGGKGTVNYRSIKVTADDKCTLNVYMMSSSSTEARAVNLLGSDGKAVDSVAIVNGTDLELFSFNIPEAGTYYLASAGNGLNVYYAALAEASEDTPDPTDPPEQPTEPEDPVEPADTTVLNANDLTEGSITGEKIVNSIFSIMGTVEVEAKKKNSDDGKFSFKNRIKLGSAGSIEARSIKITADKECSLNIYIMSSGEEVRTAKLLSDEGDPIDKITGIVGDALNCYSVNIPMAGTYYLTSASGGLNVYYAELGDPIESDTPDLTSSKILDAGDIYPKRYVKECSVNTSFSVMASEEKYVDVEEKKVSTSDGEHSVNCRIKLIGTGNISERSIKVIADDKYDLKVYMMSSGTDSRLVNLYDSTGKTVIDSAPEVNGDSFDCYTLKIPQAGTYYLVSKSGGINVCYAELTEPSEEPVVTTVTTTNASETTTTTSTTVTTTTTSSGTTASSSATTASTASTAATTTSSTTKSTASSDNKTTSSTAKTTVSTSKTTASTAKTTASTSKTTAGTTTVPKTTTTTTPGTTVKPTGVEGDVNGDSEVNLADVTALLKFLLKKTATADPSMDVNGDKKINVFDLIVLERIILDAKS